MKKLLLSFVLLSTLQFLYAYSCVDIVSSLSRNQESPKILEVQNFLFEKGFLKATPNGYFGPGTFAAVKAYQKSVGLPQVGVVGPGTRGALKKETCTSSNQGISKPVTTAVKTDPVKNTVVVATTSVIKTEPTQAATPSALRNAKRREDLEKLMRALYSRFSDSRVHPTIVTATATELCVAPPAVATLASSSQGDILVTASSSCGSYVDVSHLVPRYLSSVPRDPSLLASNILTGYLITRTEYNDITLSAKNPEDKAIIQVRCNFYAGCQKIEQISTVIYSKPSITSIDNPIFLKDSLPKDPITIHGKDFTEKNKVYLFSNYTSREYYLGEFSSKDGVTLPIPGVSLNQALSCGTGCSQELPYGDFALTIKNEGGVSNTSYLSIKGFTTSSFSARSNSSVTPKSTNVKLGTITVSSSVPLNLLSLTLKASSTKNKLPSKLKNFVLKDPLTNTSVAGQGSFSLIGQSIYENQSKLYDLYADVDEVLVEDSGFMTYGGTIKAKDLLKGREIDLPLKEFSFTVSY